MNVHISANAQKMATKAIFSIILFVVVYFIFIFMAIGIMALCLTGGIAMIKSSPSSITILLALGLSIIGGMILIFLFKFLFKRHVIDRSHWTEITRAEEPKLFDFIDQIVKEVQTDHPKRVYLSGDVNAGVFYDSSFWSLFFPVRKNLQIGLGLINSVTEQELKGVLAHEFGHFSQYGMKVGSYVYYVNHVIYNLLHADETLDDIVSWVRRSPFFSLFLGVALGIIEGMRWVMKKMYAYINMNYMALSREMEFHADEIAAHVAGYAPVKAFLLRMGLAEYSLNEVVGYYHSKLPEHLKSGNIYSEQAFVMRFLADKNDLPIKNNFPDMTKPDVARYNKSKLIIKDQWASHPGIEERVEALERLNIHKTENITTPAMDLFANKENIQERITENLFSMINYTQKPVVSALEAFKNDYTQSVMDNSFPEAYNGYYDSKNPVYVDLETIDLTADIEPVEQLFSKEKIDLVYNFVALENDKAILTSIIESGYAIDSFDYDGQKYPIDEAKNLISQIEKEIAVSEELIEKNDYKITRFFYRKAVHGGHSATYKEKYLRFFEVDTAYSKKFELYQTIMNAISFVSNKTPNEQIESNFKSVLTLEVELKREIKQLLEYPDPIHDIPEDVRRNFEKYLSREWIYFSDETYYHDPFEIFITAVNNYNNMLLRRYFLLKKDLLNYQIQLLNP